MIIVYKAYWINTDTIAKYTQHSFKKLGDGTIAGGYLRYWYKDQHLNDPSTTSTEHIQNKIQFKDKKEMNECITLIYEGFLNNEPLVDLNTIMGLKNG